MRLTTRQRRPEIGLTCFVFDGQTWRRSDFLKKTLFWNRQQILGILSPDLIYPAVYRSPLLPQKKIIKFRCSFGHDFEGHDPPNGFVHIQVPLYEISMHLSYIDFDLEKSLCLLPDVETQKQRDIFTTSIRLHPTFLLQQ